MTARKPARYRRSPEQMLVELKRRLREISDLNAASDVLNWDQATYMPEGGAEGVIETLGGRFGGYALMLSHSFNWWLKSDLFKKIGLGLLILGLLLVWMGKQGKWRKRFGYACLLIAVLGLVAVFATDMFGIGRGRPIFVYNFLDL